MIKSSLRGRQLVVLGFGTIGPTVLPLIFEMFLVSPQEVTIIAEKVNFESYFVSLGVRVIQKRLTRDNMSETVLSYVSERTFVLNLSVGISCLDIIEVCQEIGALYLDTSNEDWALYGNSGTSSTYRRRLKTLKSLEAIRNKKGVPTALLYHGANPGLVTHFAKAALRSIAQQEAWYVDGLEYRLGWGELCRKLDVLTVHVSERDTQRVNRRLANNLLMNTWSVDGFLEEILECCNFAWGTHESKLHELTKEIFTTEYGIVAELACSATSVPVRSWLPEVGVYEGYLVPHPETFSIAEELSVRSLDGRLLYQPTVQFVYSPCEMIRQNLAKFSGGIGGQGFAKEIALDEIRSGADDLGVTIFRQGREEIYWFGSCLDIDEARELSKFGNATSLQVAAGVLSGMEWTVAHPELGVCEPEQVDYRRALEVAAPFLGRWGGIAGFWSSSSEDQALSWTFEELCASGALFHTVEKAGSRAAAAT
ncbi:saccharopine dehydrogenase NADP-binding domain-containing protein [Acidiphilium sp. JA12-A1]|uniref:saccharopine dehydrogenase NADP-binding domain-containing protein n=1 Tax=Acidiphilium sp. JA12-A1 TaxID=1464546 RepID=UPI0004613871|nr:saccharopine dehydrogenase NADP-binding domain-containing protein [Acidiphilium sp. JA12-A1]KDM66229.1 homospermidine synthase Hss [Acidiphilium sp. JA12-A1]